jgi:hypothetical protein
MAMRITITITITITACRPEPPLIGILIGIGFLVAWSTGARGIDFDEDTDNDTGMRSAPPLNRDPYRFRFPGRAVKPAGAAIDDNGDNDIDNDIKKKLVKPD